MVYDSNPHVLIFETNEGDTILLIAFTIKSK